MTLLSSIAVVLGTLTIPAAHASISCPGIFRQKTATRDAQVQIPAPNMLEMDRYLDRPGMAKWQTSGGLKRYSGEAILHPVEHVRMFPFALVDRFQAGSPFREAIAVKLVNNRRDVAMGRVKTVETQDVRWESGAGRVYEVDVHTKTLEPRDVENSEFGAYVSMYLYIQQTMRPEALRAIAEGWFVNRTDRDIANKALTLDRLEFARQMVRSY